MTKRTQHITTGELVPIDDFEAVGLERPAPINVISAYDAPLQRLIDSGIVTAAEGAISWREGHLEHVARLYVSDPAQAWRDYSDDLTFALAADGSNFAMLVERARGE